MKRMIALILVGILCMGLVGCQQEPAMQAEETNSGNETAAQENESTTSNTAINYDESALQACLYGYWQDIHDGTLYLFMDDGYALIQCYKLEEGSCYLDSQPTSCSFENGKLSVMSNSAVLTLVPVEKDNIIHLTDLENHIDCVPQEQMGKFVEEIRIDLDNLETYFELRTSQNVVWDENGSILGAGADDGYFLKEEYNSRLMPASKGYESKLELTVNTRTETQWCKKDPQTGEISFTPCEYGYDSTGTYTYNADQVMFAALPVREGTEFLMNNPYDMFTAISMQAYGAPVDGSGSAEEVVALYTSILDVLSADGTIYLKVA